MEDYPVPSPGLAVWRGLRRRCPRCGQGAMFRRWFTMHQRCATCDLEFEKSQGDLWGFWVLTDRIFLFGAILALFLGFTPEGWARRSAWSSSPSSAEIHPVEINRSTVSGTRAGREDARASTAASSDGARRSNSLSKTTKWMAA